MSKRVGVTELRQNLSRYLRRVLRRARRGLPAPLELAGDPYALSRALEEFRGEG